jgi:outer membrane immunogenic protein
MSGREHLVAVGPLGDIDARGFVGGAQAGYNFRSGNFVFGIEADASFTDLDGDTADNGGNDIIEADTDFLASLRARLGVAFDTVLLYGTGGVALGTCDFKVIDDHGDTDETPVQKATAISDLSWAGV